MKSVNYALLLMVSPFIIAGCGGSSTSNIEKEASIEDVAAIVVTPTTQEDEELTVELTTADVNEYKLATWIPEIEASTGSAKLSKMVYSPSSNIISLKVESNGDNDTDWNHYGHHGSSTATITSIPDAERGNNVIKLAGDGIKNGYVLGYSFANGSTWSDSSNKTIKWSMKYSEDYIIYVRVSTTNGYRYLYYTASNNNYGVVGYDAPHYVHNGLGTTSNDGAWRTFTRNLSADLKRHDKFNEITSVDGFFVRGSGLIDDVELLETEATVVNEVIYEDAEDGTNTRWAVYDKKPAGATIANVSDSDSASKVIEVKGDGTKNGYILGAWSKDNGWKNTINKEISWDMKYNEDYVVYISVETAQGHRFMTYTPLSNRTCNTFRSTGELVGESFGLHTYGGDQYIHLGLCPDTVDGTWTTVSRNLEADIKKYEPSNSLKSITAFLIRGSGRLDNIKTFDTNTDGDYDNSTN